MKYLLVVASALFIVGCSPQERMLMTQQLNEMNDDMDQFNQSMYEQNTQYDPGVNQGTWGMQPQTQPRQIHCYRNGRGDLLCRE